MGLMWTFLPPFHLLLSSEGQTKFASYPRERWGKRILLRPKGTERGQKERMWLNNTSENVQLTVSPKIIIVPKKQ